MTAPVTYRRPLPLIAVLGPVLAVLFAVLFALAGPGSRQGWWAVGTAMTTARVAAYGGLVAGLLSVLGALATRPGTGRRGFVLSIVGVLLGFGLFLLPYVTRGATPPGEAEARVRLRAALASPATWAARGAAERQHGPRTLGM